MALHVADCLAHGCCGMRKCADAGCWRASERLWTTGGPGMRRITCQTNSPVLMKMVLGVLFSSWPMLDSCPASCVCRCSC